MAAQTLVADVAGVRCALCPSAFGEEGDSGRGVEPVEVELGPRLVTGGVGGAA